MSRRDEITNQKAQFGNKRSHALNHSRRIWNVNLHTVVIKDGKGTKRVRVSARTIKTLRRDGKIVKKVGKKPV